MDHAGLRKVLRANAVFSALSGVTLALGGGLLSDVFEGVHPWILRGIGLGLVAFALDLFVSSLKAEVPRWQAWTYSLADLAWVAGSAILLALIPLSTLATALVVGVACVVLVLAILQLRAISRLSGSARGAASP